MIKKITWFYTAALLLGGSMLAEAGTRTDYTFSAESYSGSKNRQYSVYQPDGLSSVAPMVMALHGCKQNQNDVLNDWGLTAAADRYGFILVTPFITRYDGLRNENCWGFWFDNERHQGGGEVEDLKRIAESVEADYSIDPQRRFITGLSSGGAMTVAAATAHNEYWTAAATVAGLPYGEDSASVSLSGQCPGYATFHSVARVAEDMRNEIDSNRVIPLMVLQNENDCTVLAQAGRNIRDAHLQVFGASGFTNPTAALADSQDCSPYYQNNYGCVHNTYTLDGSSGSSSVVETVFLNGPAATPNTQDTDHGHYWVGGEDGNNGKWSVRVGPSYPDIIWDFFNRQTGNGGGNSGKPVCVIYDDNPQQLNLGTVFSDAGAGCSDASGTLTVTATCNVNTTVVGEYHCDYSAENNAGSKSVRRIIKVIDPDAPLETCSEISASPAAHISAGRAAAGGSFSLRAVSNGDQQDIGYAYDSWGAVTLTEGEAGLWYAQKPAACNGTSDPDPQPDTCDDWYSTNLAHQLAGRAYYSLGYYSTGGNDSLGAVAGVYAWVKSGSTGVYQAGRCN
ncbi:MAG: esterase [Thalassobium sp.]|nr:MAG: esterase [Thalassobium sp.]